MKSSSRQEILKQISAHILSIATDHPIKVGIDGITASGKSTFARELAEFLHPSGRPIISTTLDGFHNPRSIRHQKGRESAEGYYFDAYNYPAIVEHLLLPLSAVGNLKYKTQVLDLHTDQPDPRPAQQASRNSILIVDGSFALRKELVEHWDVGIYLSVDFEIAESRASVRDAELFKSAEIAREITKKRYHGAHQLHIEVANPCERAQFIINNNDPQNPSMKNGTPCILKPTD